MLKENTETFDSVRDIIIETLGLEDHRRHELRPSTPLFGALPELDSLAVVTLAAAIEQRFGFQIYDSDFTAEVFDTVGSLSDFVNRSKP